MRLDQHRPGATGLKRIGLLLAGFVSVGLAVIGAVLPLMPSTPFVLLAAFCFARSSKRCHTWLTENRLFGRQLSQMAAGGRLSWRLRLGLAGSCWAGAAFSAVFLAPNLAVGAFSLFVAAAMTVYLIFWRSRQPEPVARLEDESGKGPEVSLRSSYRSPEA